MRTSLIAVMLFPLAVAAACQATVFWESTSAPTASLPGYETLTITLFTDNDDYIVGWEGSITGPEIHQQNPFGFLGTIFQDNNAAFDSDPATSLDADSQYLFLTSVADSVSGVLVASSSESTTHLSASFALLGGRNNPHSGTVVPLAQICIPQGGEFTLTGEAVLRTPANVLHGQVPLEVPEPATLALLALCGAGLARRRRA